MTKIGILDNIDDFVEDSAGRFDEVIPCVLYRAGDKWYLNITGQTINGLVKGVDFEVDGSVIGQNVRALRSAIGEVL